MSPHSKVWIRVLLLAAALAGLWWWKSGQSNMKLASSQSSESSPSSHRAAADTVNPISSVFSQLPVKPDRAVVLQSLNELRAKLKAMPPDEAVLWIRSFLENGQDKPTGLSFVIGNDQEITESPTFRTFLIDAIFSIDPAAAAALCREILGTPTTPDEWALALRNIGRAETSPKANAFLREKTEALIANPEWQADPSIGFFESFDVLVHTDATESTPLLSSLIQRKDRKDLAHAGFLTLDRLVERDPADTLTRLATDRAIHQSRPEMTAQQFARADLRDPAQRDIIKNWLLDPARTDTELRNFSATYPNNNHFISNNLLTREHEQHGDDLATHDRVALEIINTWAADPAFESVKPSLTTMQQRIATFINQKAESKKQ